MKDIYIYIIFNPECMFIGSRYLGCPQRFKFVLFDEYKNTEFCLGKRY